MWRLLVIFLCLGHHAFAGGPQGVQYVFDSIERPLGPEVLEGVTPECTLQRAESNAVASTQRLTQVKNPSVWSLTYDERIRIETVFKSLVDKELWTDATCLSQSLLKPIQPRTQRETDWSAL